MSRAGGGTSRRYVGGFVFACWRRKWVRVAHPMMYLSWLGVRARAAAVLGAGARSPPPARPPRACRWRCPVPVVWVALEYMRMHFPTGFPFLKPLGLYQMIGFGWYFLGYTQHAIPAADPDRGPRRRVRGVVRRRGGERAARGLGAAGWAWCGGG